MAPAKQVLYNASIVPSIIQKRAVRPARTRYQKEATADSGYLTAAPVKLGHLLAKYVNSWTSRVGCFRGKY